MVPPHGNRGPIDYKTSSFNFFSSLLTLLNAICFKLTKYK